jgi:streptomycin 6-kinase
LARRKKRPKATPRRPPRRPQGAPTRPPRDATQAAPAGTQLLGRPEDEILAVAVDLIPLLWREAPAGVPFRSLAAEAPAWADDIETRGIPHGSEAVHFLREAAAVAEPVLVNQDLHAGNILRGTRTPWLAIDPKPMVGDRALTAAALVRDMPPLILAADHPRRVVARRLDALSGGLGIDRDRLRLWATAHTLHWSAGFPAMEAVAAVIASA